MYNHTYTFTYMYLYYCLIEQFPGCFGVPSGERRQDHQHGDCQALQGVLPAIPARRTQQSM